MLKLYTFGEKFGLPDPSPFVMKAMVLLKMANLKFETGPANLQKAPKGKAPYLRDGDTYIADSTFIRFYLEDKYGIDFDPGLTNQQKATAWAFEKLCDENLYFMILRERWMDDDNFNRGPVEFFDAVPYLLRRFIIKKVRGDIINKTLKGQGIGRHTDEEVAQLSHKTLKSISDFLADKPFFMGDTPCSADASVFPSIAGCLCPPFECSVRDNAEKFPNLKSYAKRGMEKYFPDINYDI